jgi:hypothetical protein
MRFQNLKFLEPYDIFGVGAGRGDGGGCILTLICIFVCIEGKDSLTLVASVK